MAAFIPGASPPLVKTAIFRWAIRGIPYTTGLSPPSPAELLGFQLFDADFELVRERGDVLMSGGVQSVER
jgi:hypothetical protein